MAKTISDFKVAHDPTHKVDNPAPVFARPLPRGCKRFIITCAQNATPVAMDFWAVLLNIARLNDAQILVIPLRYKNPTSSWSRSQENAEIWDDAVVPFLWNQRVDLNDNVQVLGDIKIQPTAVSPLTANEALSTSLSGVIGHPKLQLKCVPTPANRMAKIMTTTGACTVQNYTDSRAGKVGEFHHSLAAVLVELDGKRFHLRHLHFDAKSKTVTDLNVRYDSHGVGKAPRPLALAMGDTHVDFIDPQVKAATFGKGGMVDTLRPQTLIWHDLLDAYSCNPHHFGKPFNAIAKRAAGADDVRAEVMRAIQFVHKHTPDGVRSVIVGSNHNDMLRRWIDTNDWKRDPVNAEFYLETALAMKRGTRLTAKGTSTPDPFTYWFRHVTSGVSRPGKPDDDFTALDSDESFTLAGVELGMHGDQGPNGARGSIRNLRRLGVKSIIGHSHTPGIDEGAYQVGTSTRLRLEYNTGPSAWLNAHCILHADGKRQLVVIVDGKWRA